MAKVIMICGKISSGKSTYAEQLRQKGQAVVLSVDEVMLSLFDPYLGERHDEYAGRVQRFLFKKSVELIAAGVDVILDWGFWSKDDRRQAREFYAGQGIACEFRYIAVDDAEWKRRVAQRNAQVLAGKSDAYFVDENLMKKFEEKFEEPEKGEIEVWMEEKRK